MRSLPAPPEMVSEPSAPISTSPPASPKRRSFPPNSVDTTAKVHHDKTDGGFGVTRIDLETVGDVPGIDEATFQKIAEGAKENCPISRLLSPGAQISLSAKLA